jgi:drug/metabolite transporter (DMT)-like permease
MYYQTGVLLVLIAGVCYGFIPIFSLYAYEEGLGVIDFNFYRFLVATIVFFLYLIARGIKIRLNRNQVFRLFILGGVLNLLQSIFFVSAVKYISAGLTTLLFFTHPMLVAVFSYFEGVKLSRGTVAAIFISFGGLALVLGTSFGNVSILGIALSLAASVIYATFIVLGNRVVEDVNPAVMCTFVSLFTIVTLFPLAMINGGLGLPSTLKGWFVTAGCGIVGSTIPFVAFFAGITVVGATTASIIANAEPVTAVILSALLFSQHLTGMQLLGGVLILAGGTIAVLAKKRIVKGASP